MLSADSDSLYFSTPTHFVIFFSQIIFFCLVFFLGNPAQHPKIWLLDRALRWHFLASTFSQYFRMMLMHLGLPQWQYAYTDIGLTPQAKVRDASDVVVVCVVGIKTFRLSGFFFTDYFCQHIM